MHQILQDTRLAVSTIEQACGQRPHWFWPPYIERTPALESAVWQENMAFFPMDLLVDSRDYDINIDGAELMRNIESGAEDGCVILLYEWRAESLQLLPELFARLQRQGGQFLTLSGLAGRRSASSYAPARVSNSLTNPYP